MLMSAMANLLQEFGDWSPPSARQNWIRPEPLLGMQREVGRLCLRHSSCLARWRSRFLTVIYQHGSDATNLPLSSLRQLGEEYRFEDDDNSRMSGKCLSVFLLQPTMIDLHDKKECTMRATAATTKPATAAPLVPIVTGTQAPI